MSGNPQSGSLKPFARIGVVTFLAMVPVTLFPPMLRPLIQESYNVSDTLTHYFMSVNMLGAILFAPVAGALSDRLGRRRPIVAAALVLDAALLFAMSLTPSFAALMIVRFFEGGSHIFAISLLMAMGVDLARSEQRGAGMGIVAGCLTIGTAVGPLIGGTLGRSHPTIVFYLGAGIALFACLLASLLLPETGIKSRPESLARTASLTLGTPDLRAPYAFAFIDRFTVGFMVTSFSLFMTKFRGLSPMDVGVALFVFLVFFAALSYPFGRFSDKFSRTWLLIAGSILYGILVASYGFTPVSMLYPVMAVGGTMAAMKLAPNMAIIGDLASPDNRGTYMGGFNSAGSLGFMAGAAVAGAVLGIVSVYYGEFRGYQAAFLVAGGSEFLCLLLTFPALRRLVREGKTT